ncbi:MAG: 50S ribosomal protein L6 [archaeon]
MAKKDILENIEIPSCIKVALDNEEFTVTGPKGTVIKKFSNPYVEVSLKEKSIELLSKNATKRQKAVINTYKVLFENLFTGVSEGYAYKMKICSGHFPMNVTFGNGTLTIKNLLGEKFPRTLKIDKNIKVKVEGSEITVEGCDKELVGQTVANIERRTKRPNFDIRIFQDGIFLTSKTGKL